VLSEWIYRLLHVVRGIVEEEQQSLEVVDDTLTDCYPQNQRIIQGLKVVFDARLLSGDTER